MLRLVSDPCQNTDGNRCQVWSLRIRAPGGQQFLTDQIPFQSTYLRGKARGRDDNIRQHLLKKHMKHSTLISYLYYLVSNVVRQAYYVKKHMYMKMLVFCFLRSIIKAQERSDFMAQISLRVDDDVKRGAEQTFDDIGLSMSTAINIFLKKVARERRIPFELSADPFYSESNIRYLEKKMEDYKAGRLNFAEHELIEE